MLEQKLYILERGRGEREEVEGEKLQEFCPQSIQLNIDQLRFAHSRIPANENYALRDTIKIVITRSFSYDTNNQSSFESFLSFVVREIIFERRRM